MLAGWANILGRFAKEVGTARGRWRAALTKYDVLAVIRMDEARGLFVA
jgi:hypothetical protein